MPPAVPAVQVLLLDEITVDMDVVGRLDLLQFFTQECQERGAPIIYVSQSPGRGVGLVVGWVQEDAAGSGAAGGHHHPCERMPGQGADGWLGRRDAPV